MLKDITKKILIKYNNWVFEQNKKKIELMIEDHTKVSEIHSMLKETTKQNQQLIQSIEQNRLKIDTHLIKLNNNIKQLDYINLELLNNNIKQLDYINLELLNLNSNSKLKKVLIVGFYGAPNLGDELMLETLLSYYVTLEDIEVTVMLCDNPNYSISDYPQVNVIHYPKTIYDYNIIANYFDTIIFGGGAILDENQYLYNPFDCGSIFVELSLRAIAFKKQCISIGLSSNDKLNDEKYIHYLEYIINNSTYFSVRDQNSRNIILNKIPSVKNKIKLTTEIVAAHPIFQQQIDIDSQGDIGIVWIYTEETQDTLKKIIIELLNHQKIKNKKQKIRIIPFYGYVNNDISFIEKIKKDLKNENIVVEKLAKNMSETLTIISKCSCLIAMRYHAIFLAYLINIRCLPIMYDTHSHYKNKINYLNEIFQQDTLLNYTEITKETFKETYEKVQIKQINKNISKNIINTAKTEIQEIVKKYFNN